MNQKIVVYFHSTLQKFTLTQTHAFLYKISKKNYKINNSIYFLYFWVYKNFTNVYKIAKNNILNFFYSKIKIINIIYC